MTRKTIWTGSFACLILSVFLISCANYIFASSMAVYAEKVVQVGTKAWLITAAFYFGSVGMRLVNGTLVQKYGTRILMIMSAGICVFACFMHGLAGTIIALVLIRVLHGAGYSIFTTASGTAASYMVPKERLGEGMGYFTIGNVLAMAFGPSLALTIVSDNTASAFYRLFLVTALVCLAALVLVLCMKSNVGDQHQISEKRENSSTQKNLPPTFLGFEKGVVLPVLISFLMTFAYSPVIVYLSVYGLQKGWQNVGVAFTMYAVGLLTSRIFTGRLSDRFGPDCVMIPAYLCGATALILIALCQKIWQLHVAMVILGLCIGAYNPQINVFGVSRCTQARRGTATAAFNGAGDLGLAVGSAVSGIYIAHFGFVATYLNGAVLCMLIMFLYFFTLSKIPAKIWGRGKKNAQLGDSKQ